MYKQILVSASLVLAVPFSGFATSVSPDCILFITNATLYPTQEIPANGRLNLFARGLCDPHALDIHLFQIDEKGDHPIPVRVEFLARGFPRGSSDMKPYTSANGWAIIVDSPSGFTADATYKVTIQSKIGRLFLYDECWESPDAIEIDSVPESRLASTAALTFRVGPSGQFFEPQSPEITWSAFRIKDSANTMVDLFVCISRSGIDQEHIHQFLWLLEGQSRGGDWGIANISQSTKPADHSDSCFRKIALRNQPFREEPVRFRPVLIRDDGNVWTGAEHTIILSDSND